MIINFLQTNLVEVQLIIAVMREAASLQAIYVMVTSIVRKEKMRVIARVSNLSSTYVIYFLCHVHWCRSIRDHTLQYNSMRCEYKYYAIFSPSHQTPGRIKSCQFGLGLFFSSCFYLHMFAPLISPPC